MHLAWLELVDFRCYTSLRFEPEPGINVLIGANGAGKTSVLEAVGYLGLLRSVRRTPDEALVRVGAAAAVVRGGFATPAGETTVEIELPAGGRRRILLNAKRPTRNREVLTHVPVVAFIPDDLDLVKRGPAQRREYLDDLAAQLWPQAAADQTEYARTLRQRNSLLRQEGSRADPGTLAVWDERLATGGAQLLLHRRRVMAELDGPFGESYRLVGGTGGLTWSYRSNWMAGDHEDVAGLTGALQATLEQRRGRDMEQRTTTAGPHRDGPALVLDGRDARTRSSQGEQRTAALSLRVGAYRLVGAHGPLRPVLLLDDVFSELDPSRVRGVLDLLGDGQVLVTSARDDEVPIAGRRWQVQEGGIS